MLPRQAQIAYLCVLSNPPALKLCFIVWHVSYDIALAPIFFVVTINTNIFRLITFLIMAGEDQGPLVLSIVITTLALGGIFIFARTITRSIIRTQFGWDDGLIIFTWVRGDPSFMLSVC